MFVQVTKASGREVNIHRPFVFQTVDWLIDVNKSWWIVVQELLPVDLCYLCMVNSEAVFELVADEQQVNWVVDLLWLVLASARNWYQHTSWQLARVSSRDTSTPEHKPQLYYLVELCSIVHDSLIVDHTPNATKLLR